MINISNHNNINTFRSTNIQSNNAKNNNNNENINENTSNI